VTRNRIAVERVSVFIEVVRRSCSRRLRAHGEAAEGHGRRAARTVAARADRRAEPAAQEVATAAIARHITARARGEAPFAAVPLDAQARRGRAAERAARNCRRNGIRLGETNTAATGIDIEHAVGVGRARAAARGSAETASHSARRAVLSRGSS